MNHSRQVYSVQAIQNLIAETKIKMRKQLNADSMFAAIRQDFNKITDHRANNSKIPLGDILMSGFAVFSLKDPSLLAFDERRCNDPESLHGVYGIGVIPCDSQMRVGLDPISPDQLRQPFLTLFNHAQRSKALEKFKWLDDHYLLALDGSGIYSSEKVSSEHCLGKRKRNGKTEYYQQLLGAAFVSPGLKEVFPLCPEMISKQDGTKKQDCERNATRRWLEKFRKEHPYLKCVVIEDGLSSNGPHIKNLMEHDLRFILGAKEKDHVYLFEQMDSALNAGQATEFSTTRRDGANGPEITDTFRFVNGITLNKSHPDLQINMLEYWQVDDKGKELHFCWVTDLALTNENVNKIMQAGRARWRIENETFNTLKNQGYNLGHNFGLGKKHLSAVFIHLMMLAFLVDQIQQLCCPLFNAAWEHCKSKRYLWECVRSTFKTCIVPSMEVILRVIMTNMKIRLL
jgi:hypothetical protein